MTSLTHGLDAKIIVGGTSAANGFLVTSSSNQVDSVIDGVTINLLQVSDNPVTLTVKRDTDTIISKVKAFVTAFNDAVGRIDQYDFFNVDTQQKGPLLGDPTAARVRDALLRTVQQKAQGVTSQYQRLQQVGVSIGAKSTLQFDQEKFTAAYESDPQAVENLFAAFEASAATSEEIAPGVTVVSNQQTVTVRGFGDIFDNLMDGLTNTVDGTMTLADKNFQSQIDLLNNRISDFNQRLEAKRARLQAQFAAMESALAQLQGQGNALGSLAGNLAIARGQ